MTRPKRAQRARPEMAAAFLCADWATLTGAGRLSAQKKVMARPLRRHAMTSILKRDNALSRPPGFIA